MYLPLQYETVMYIGYMFLILLVYFLLTIVHVHVQIVDF
jgi:hypothetical protein